MDGLRLPLVRNTLDVSHIMPYHIDMIKSFRNKRTLKFYEGKRVKLFQSFSRQAEKRLRILDAADTIEALMLLPSNRFEALGGDRQGQYSIRINDQWRVCFEWKEGKDGPEYVEITDYH